MPEHKFQYRWRLADGYPAAGVDEHGATVFGTFICGGGSTMGYKLAGYHHLGGVEIDSSVAAIYKNNNDPKHLFVEDLLKFNTRNDLPDELYDLDVLDGSPPCSTFSMAGSREKAWGKKKVFREGQKEQTLDDLVFVYCDTIAKLNPRVCLLENVSGLVKGNARGYCRRIMEYLDEAGYRVQVFLLNAANMGVPQTRQRTFFIGLRKDFDYLPKLKIEVNEAPILFGDCIDDKDTQRRMSDRVFNLWLRRMSADNRFADILIREEGLNILFNSKLEKRNRVCSTLTAVDQNFTYDYPRRLNRSERLLCSSFPTDYRAEDKDIAFLTGMSVSPVQMAHIADAIWNQWLKPIREGTCLATAAPSAGS